MGPFHPGDPLPDHAAFNDLLRRARSGRLASVSDGLALKGPDLALLRPARIWAKLSGAGPAYGFAEATPAGSGTFALVAGGRTDVGGKQPAYELNAAGGLAGTYQRLAFSAAGDWRFQAIRAGSGSSGTGTSPVSLPGCICDALPMEIAMTSAVPTCNYGMFQSCSISYQATPAGYASLSLGTYCYLSNSSFPDVIAGGALFQYVLSCYGAQFNLSRVYLESPYGSPYHDGLLYSWVIGGYGSSCTPFALFGGMAYPGSDADCGVTLAGVVSP